jgi:glycerol-3-phosphate O-acyltransferase
MGVLATILNAGETDKVPLRRVEEDYTFLQDLFQYEFTFSRRQALRSHLEKLIEYLEKKELVRFEDNVIQLLPDSRAKLELFSSPLTNFFEGYYLLWRTLSRLGQRRWESKELLQFIQERGRILFLKEEIDHPESISKFTLQNALTAFRDLGLLLEEKEGWDKKKKTFYSLKGPGDVVGTKLRNFLRKNQ